MVRWRACRCAPLPPYGVVNSPWPQRQADARHDAVERALFAARILQVDAVDVGADEIAAAVEDERVARLRDREEVGRDAIVAEPRAVAREDAGEKLRRALAALVANGEDVQVCAAVRRPEHPPLRSALAG